MKILERKQFVGLDLDTEEQLIDPTSYRNALNVRIGHEISDAGAVKSIRGNTKLWDPPGGENQTIGIFEDGKSGRLIFFNWNDGGDHGIYYYNLTDETVYPIIETVSLNFSKNQFITGAGVVNDLLFFNDEVNPPRQVVIGFDYSVIPDDELDINLHHKPPFFAPTVFGSKDSDRIVNQVITDSYQFATRYEYIDDTLTPFSPLSDLQEALQQPDPYEPVPADPLFYNQFIVEDPLTDVNLNVIKAVQFAYQKNNDGNYFVFERMVVKDPLTFEAKATFTNDGTARAVGAADTAKLFESIPSTCRALGVTQNRMFLGNVTEGLTVDPDDAAIDVQFQTGSTILRGRYKHDGQYQFGMVWADERRMSSVKALTRVAVNQKWASLTDSFARVTVTGTPPPWAKYFRIVRTKDTSVANYVQLSVNPLFYRSQFDEKLQLNETDFVIAENNVYLRNIPSDETGTGNVLLEKNKFAYLHIQLPKGLPFVPDRTYFVRILTVALDVNKAPSKVERVLDVRGDILVVKPFGIQDWTSLMGTGTGTGSDLKIEIFKPNEADSELLFEVTNTLPLDQLGVVQNVQGDTYRLQMTLEREFKFYPKDAFVWNGTTATDKGYFIDAFAYGVFESRIMNAMSPSPALKDEETDTTVIASNINEVPSVEEAWIYDYEKIADRIGRPNAPLDEEETINREGLIRYSNTFIEDSNINGLASFDALNQYQLPVERSPIRKLQPVKNIMLAILERETTSLYIGEGFIKEADGSDSLIKTSQVIGDDRVLSGSGNFGTINPESVVEHDGQVYWWDAYNGAVCRYTNAGVFPISEYGMSSFFRKVALDYLGVPVVGGYDPKYDEYLLTFYPKDENFPGFTIMFDVRSERWISFMSFQPEYFGKLSNKLFSFQGGSLYEHDTSQNYNEFYGTQYERKLTFISNQDSNKIKVFTNIHMDADSITLDETSGIKVVEAWTNDKQTFIPAHEIINREGLYRSHIYGNVLGDFTENFRQGAPMRGHVLTVQINNNRSDQSLLRSANIVYHHSEYSN